MKWAVCAIVALTAALVAQAYEFRRLEQHPDYYTQPEPTPDPTEETPCYCPPFREDQET